MYRLVGCHKGLCSQVCKVIYVKLFVCTCIYYLCVLFQVSDVEKILGIVHTENLQVTAEAYDIALDIAPGRHQQF